jgi:transcriptional regulator
MGTIRQSIIFVLKDQEMTAKDISQAVGIREKEVYEHLVHIARSKIAEGKFIPIPSTCKNCGFVFRKRERLTPPGKCFICRSEAITPPRFIIRTSPQKGRGEPDRTVDNDFKRESEDT